MRLYRYKYIPIYTNGIGTTVSSDNHLQKHGLETATGWLGASFDTSPPFTSPAATPFVAADSSGLDLAARSLEQGRYGAGMCGKSTEECLSGDKSTSHPKYSQDITSHSTDLYHVCTIAFLRKDQPHCEELSHLEIAAGWLGASFDASPPFASPAATPSVAADSSGLDLAASSLEQGGYGAGMCGKSTDECLSDDNSTSHHYMTHLLPIFTGVYRMPTVHYHTILTERSTPL